MKCDILNNEVKKMNINNIDITINKTTKYTNVLFNIYFLINYNENWPYLQFVSEMLSKCNNVNKTMEEQFQYLYGLYGTGLYVGKFANYKTMGLKVTLDCINQKIVNEKNLYNECFEAMKTMLFDPHVFTNKNGEKEFDKKDLNEVKNNVINELINEANDKRRYANYRFLKKMTRNDEFPLTLKTTIGEIKSSKGTDVYNFYNDLVNNSKIVISVIGDIEENDITTMIEKLGLNSKNIDLEFEDKNIFMDCTPKRITEKANIKQAHINMGYRTDILYRHELYPAYLMFNIMFGELPSSTLFSTIREEQGLAYSVYSSVFPIRNAMFIYAGVDNEKINLAINSIKKQLEMYQSGEILKDNREYFENLLNAAKNEFKNEYINSLDSQTGVLAQDIKSAIVDRRSMKELYEDSINVTLEDVVSASKHLSLDTIYVLKGGK